MSPGQQHAGQLAEAGAPVRRAGRRSERDQLPGGDAPEATEILDKYLQALGGTAQLARLTSFTAKGTYSGFDTDHKEIAVDIYAKAPNQRTWIIHMPDGDSFRVFDGRNGWWVGPDAPAPETLTSGNLDRYRLEALVAFPAGIKQAFKRMEGRPNRDRRSSRPDRSRAQRRRCFP